MYGSGEEEEDSIRTVWDTLSYVWWCTGGVHPSCLLVLVVGGRTPRGIGTCRIYH